MNEQLKGIFFDLWLFNAHSPTDKDDEKKDQFYEDLEKVYASFLKNDERRD